MKKKAEKSLLLGIEIDIGIGIGAVPVRLAGTGPG